MSVIGELMIRAGIDIADVITGSAAIGKELDGLASQVEKNFAGIDKMGARMKDFGMGLTAAITLPLAGIAAASLNMAAGFEAGMNKVQALGDITGQALKDLEAEALDLGAKTKYSAKEAADGMGELAAAGMNATQIAKAMPGVLDLASAGEMAVGAAAQVASNLMGQFGVKAEDLGHAVDIVAKAAASGSQSVKEMAVTLKYIGTVASSAGLSLAETSAAITELANAGIKGSSAGTALRGIIASLIAAANATKGAAHDILEKYNISINDAKGNMRSLADLMGDFNKSGITLGETFKLVGREPATAFLALKKAGGDALRSLTADLENSEGAAKRMADTLNSGLAGSFERAKGSIETLGIVIGKALEPVAIKLAAFVENTANKLGEWATAFGKLPVGVQEASLAFLAFAAAVGPVLVIAGSMAQGFVAISAAVVPFVSAMSGIGLSIAGLGAEMTTAQVAFAGFSAALLAIGGVALFIEQLGELSTNIKGLASDLGISSESFIKFADSFAGLLKDVTGVTTEMDFLKGIFSGLTGGIDDYISSITKAGKYTTDFGEAAGGTAKHFSALELAWNDFKTAVSGNWMAVLFGPIGALNETIKTLRESLALLTGKFPEMDAAARKAAAGLQATVTAHDKVSEASLKTAASQRGVVTSFDASSAATAKVSKALVETGDEHEKLSKKAEAAAARSAAAYKRSGEEINKALADLGQAGAKQIDSATNSLGILEKAYDKGRITIEQYSAASIVAAQKVEDALKKSFATATALMKENALKPIEITWHLQEGMGEAVAKLIDNVAVTKPHIDIPLTVLFPPESSEAVKKASESVLAVDDALKRLGIDQAKVAEAAKVSANDYAVLQAAALKGTIAQSVADQAHAKALEDVIKDMKAHHEAVDEDGVSVEQYQAKLDGLKGKLGEVTKATKESEDETEKWGKSWGKFADDVGETVGNLAGDLGKLMFTGEGSFGAIMTKGWQDLRESLVKDFVDPATEILKDFALNSLKSLIGGGGIGGVVDAWKEMGKAAKEAFGLAADSAKEATKATKEAAKWLGDTSEAAYNPTSAVSGATKMDGVTATGGGGGDAAGGIMGALAGGPGALIQMGISAAAGITAGLQMAHLISTAGHIEVNTREMSTVMWQTGSESLQGLAKDTRNVLLKINDRLIDVRDALFAPVALSIEAIDITLKSVILPALRGIGSATSDAADQTDTNADTNTQSLADAIQNGIDANNAAQQEALAVANGIAGAANLTAEDVAALKDISSSTATSTAATADNTSNLAGTITQSGGEVINALGQTGSQVVQNAANNTQAVIDQIAALGSDLTAAATITGNAYSDIKSTMIGVVQTSNKQLGEFANDLSKQISEGIFGAAQRSTSYTDEILQKLGLEGKNPWIPRTGGDNSNLYTGPAQFMPLAPAVTPTVGNTWNSSPSFADMPGITRMPYIAPSAYTSAPNTSGPGAAYSRTSKYPVQYADQGNALNVNIFGNVTGVDEAKKMMTKAAQQLAVANVY